MLITVAGAALALYPDSQETHQTSLLTCPDPKAGRHLMPAVCALRRCGVKPRRCYHRAVTETAEQRVARWRGRIAELLGREPRGLRDIAAFNAEGEPAVIRVASLVDGKPFPTLFWLVDPALNLSLDRLEAAGTIAMLQAEVDAEPELRAAMLNDHAAHRRLRAGFLSVAERDYLEAHGMGDVLANRGIGGIAEPDRIRCLHTWYAAHLVETNSIGTRLEARWLRPPTSGDAMLRAPENR